MKKIVDRLIFGSIILLCMTILLLAARERYDKDTISYERVHRIQEMNSAEVDGVAILVAYRINKSSRMWLQNPATSRVYEIGLFGGSMPNIGLGAKIPVKYKGGDIMIDSSLYTVRTDSKYRFEYLPGYNSVYP